MNSFLKQYIPLSEMLVQTFGKDVEVVLHNLATPEHSVVYVANGIVTGRKVGDSFDQLIKQVLLSKRLENDYVANYYFTAKNGRLIRSSTLLLRDSNEKLQGALCINVDTTKITQQIECLQALLPGLQQNIVANEISTEQQNDLESKEAATVDSEHIVDMVTSIIDNILQGSVPGLLSREEKIDKIRFMDAKGIFLMKGSIELVAEKLGVNKVTVYSYLDEARGKR